MPWMPQVCRLTTIAAVAAFWGLGSCRGAPGPGQVATDYLRSEFSGQRAEAYAHVAADDRAVRTLAEYKAEAGAIDEAIQQMIAGQVSVTVGLVVERDDSATVVATVTHPDLLAVMGDLFGVALASAFTGDTAKAQRDMAAALHSKYAGKPLPTTTTTDTVDLVREAEGWRVVRYWRAETLEERADSLREDGELREALALYDSALALGPRRTTATAARETVVRSIAAEEAKQAYVREHLALERFRVGTGRRFGFGNPQPAVFGTIRNRGDSTLTRVQITVYFLGADGKPIAEKRFSPVLVTEFSLSDEGPLRPGYVRDFGYSVEDDAPSGWTRKARAEITRIEFQSEQRRR